MTLTTLQSTYSQKHIVIDIRLPKIKKGFILKTVCESFYFIIMSSPFTNHLISFNKRRLQLHYYKYK